MRRFWPILVAAAFLFAAGRPARASIHIDLSLATPYIGLREFAPDETDHIYQAYGLELRGHYVAEKSGFQMELGYVYAPEDMGGRAIACTGERAVLRIPWQKEQGESGTTLYSYVLSWQHDQWIEGTTAVYEAQTGLLGVEIYAGEKESGSFVMGTGVGRRQLRVPEHEAAGYAASVWLNFTVPLGQHAEFRFAQTTVWAWPEGTGYRVMEKDSTTCLGLGFAF